MHSSNYNYFPVRTAAILTNAYVAGLILGPTEISGTQNDASPSVYNQLNIYWGFTKGSLTSGELKVEFSHDGTTYYQETASAVAGGTSTESLLIHTITATGNYRISVPLKDNYVKISAQGTGTVTASSATVSAVIGIT